MTTIRFPLNINISSTRPIFKAEINGIITTCMLDTGADMPVFCKGQDLFFEWVRDMKEVTFFSESTIGGFGKSEEKVLVYSIPEFTLSDEKNYIIYKNMKIAVMLKPRIPCDLILSAPLFMKMRCTLDCLEEQHYLTVEAKKDIFGTGFYKAKETIYIFAEEE